MLGLCLATLATNIAANVVGPANDFANLWPRRISFRIGGLITGVIGILIQPWRLVDNAVGVHLQVADRLFAAAGRRRRRAHRRLLPDPPRRGSTWPACTARAGRTGIAGGFNSAALVALAAGIAPCLPGFLAAVRTGGGAGVLDELYDYAWFVSFGVSFAVYAVWLRCAPLARSWGCSGRQGKRR